MTVYVTSDDERALVEITPDDRNKLSIGLHVLYCYDMGTTSQPRLNTFSHKDDD